MSRTVRTGSLQDSALTNKATDVTNRSVNRRTFLMGAATLVGSMSLVDVIAACGGSSSQGSSGPPTPIVVGANGGTSYDQLYAAVFKPFEKKYNAQVVPVFGDANTLLAKALAEKDNPTMDMCLVGPGLWLIGQQNGVFEKVNYNNIPNIADVYDFLKDPNGYAPNVTMFGWGLVYNSKTVTNPPVSFRDIWDPRFKGQVMLPVVASAAQLLIAAVSYYWSGDQHNDDLAFSKIKELMPNVTTFFGLVADAQSKFQQGVAQVATWYSSFLNGAGVPLAFQTPTEGAFAFAQGYQVVTGTKKKDLAEKLIGQFFDPQSCAALAKVQNLIPANKTTQLDPELAKAIMPVDQVLKMKTWDYTYTVANRTKWIDRWNAEVVPLLKH